jgi:transposase InsO family protein
MSRKGDCCDNAVAESFFANPPAAATTRRSSGAALAKSAAGAPRAPKVAWIGEFWVGNYDPRGNIVSENPY